MTNDERREILATMQRSFERGYTYGYRAGWYGSHIEDEYDATPPKGFYEEEIPCEQT